VEGHLNWWGKNGDLGAMSTVWSSAKPLVEGLGQCSPPEDEGTFVKICYLTVLIMTRRYLHSLPCVQYEMEEKSIWRQKSGRFSGRCRF